MKTHTVKKICLIGAMGFILVSSIGYWVHNQFYISTNDAYVNANVIQIAPRITGQVAELHIKNNQYVSMGEPLFDLDETPYQIRVDRAMAKLSMSEAELLLAQHTAMRVLALVKEHAASIQRGDDAKTVLQASIAEVAFNKAVLAEAELDLQYTKITAPTSGWLTMVNLREGDVIAANQSVFALISDHEFWVDANFKETELKKIHLGEKAEVCIDMYDAHCFKGLIESISGGTGNAFSLLPAENATGNWVKVTQRVPVRVRILDVDPHYPLRIGTSATVTIHL